MRFIGRLALVILVIAVIAGYLGSCLIEYITAVEGAHRIVMGE